MSNHFEELRTARREGRPLHQANTQMSDRFHELRTARREGRPLHQSNTSKKRDDTTKEPHPGSRYRRPTPRHIELHRHEGVSEPYPKGDSPLVDALRGRSRSSPPPRTRAPTPHPRASAPRMTKKTVHWADPLEQPTPQKIGAERKRRDSETPKKGVEETQVEAQSCTLRRYRPSGIPRPKPKVPESEVSKVSCSSRRPTPIFTVKVKLASQARQPPQCPPSALIPAPLHISPSKTSTRRAPNTIPSTASAPEVHASTRSSREPSQPRNFSFEEQPEVITLSPNSRRTQQHHVPQTTQEKPSSQEKSSSSPPTPFSYLKEKPRRRGTVRPRPSEAKPISAVVVAESSKPPLPSSSSTSSFHTAKTFWSDLSDGNSKNHDSCSKSPSPIKQGPGPSDVTSALDRASSSPSKSKIPVPKIPIPSSTSSSSFHAAKNFWSGISSSSSCGAIIDGSEDVKPVCGPSAVADRAEVCKTSRVAELARYTVNRPVNGPVKAQSSIIKTPISGSAAGSVASGQFKSKIPVSSTSSYHVTKTQESRYVPLRAVSGGSASRFQSSLKPPVDAGSSVSGSSNTSSYRTAQSHPRIASQSQASASASSPKTTSTALTTSILPNNDLEQAEHTPTLQSQLWNDVMNLCISESSSCPQYCDCDDCACSGQEGVDRCSTVAHVDDGKCKGR